MMPRVERLMTLAAAYRFELIGAAMKALSILIVFGVTTILARVLEVGDFGRFAALQGGLYLAIALAKFGGPMLIVRELAIARKTDRPDLVNGLFRVTRLYILCLAGLAVLAAPLVWIATARLLQNLGPGFGLLMITVVWAWATLALWDALTRGYGRVLLGQMAELLVRPGVFFIAVAVGWAISTAGVLDLGSVLMMFAASAFAAFGFSLWNLSRLPRVEAQPLVPWRRWARDFVQFGAIGVLGSIALQLEILLLATLASPEETAYYKVATQIGMLTTFGLGVVNLQFAPVIAEYIAEHRIDDLQRIAIRSSRFSLLFAAPLFLIALFVGGPLTALLFGADFAQASYPLQWVVTAQLVNATCGSVALILSSGGRQAWVLRTGFFTLALGVCMNLVLIPPLGAVGAAISFATALIVWNVVLLWLVWRIYGVLSLPVGRARSAR